MEHGTRLLHLGHLEPSESRSGTQGEVKPQAHAGELSASLKGKFGKQES